MKSILCVVVRLLIDVAGVVFLFVILPSMLRSLSSDVHANVSFWLGIATMAVLVGMKMYSIISIPQTKISVYEGGIAGTSLVKVFPDLMDFAVLRSFHFTYDNIKRVSAYKFYIIFYASGAHHKCYVANPAEIQRVIVEQRQKAKAQHSGTGGSC